MKPFRFIEPTFYAGLLDDPLLLVRIRPLGVSLLFDCGQIHHLAKRVLKSITAIFISHAHMDHFMGIDTFIRHNHVSPKSIDIFGPPGIASKMEAKFAAYDWNLTEPNWCTFRVHEIHSDHVVSFSFAGPEGFPRRCIGEKPRVGRNIYRNDFVAVEADLCDHKIPTLIFRLTERTPFAVDNGRMATLGLVGGDWLRELKRRFYAGDLRGKSIPIMRRNGEAIHEELADDGEALYESIRECRYPASIGYATDIGFTNGNVSRILALQYGVTLFVCECSFIAADRDKAEASAHLCTSDLNALAAALHARFILPMHLSKSYIDRSHLLYEQLQFPPGTTLIRLPVHLTPRPLLPEEAIRLPGT